MVETGEIVAIKKVLQDKRFKNRELQIMRLLVKDGHSNIVGLKHCFYSQVSYLFHLIGCFGCFCMDRCCCCFLRLVLYISFDCRDSYCVRLSSCFSD